MVVAKFGARDNCWRTLASLTLTLEAVCIVELLSSHFSRRERIDVRNGDLRDGETEENGERERVD